MEKETMTAQDAYIIEGVGQVQIAEEVVAVIAGIAATEVDGVSKMHGNITKGATKGVKIDMDDDNVSVSLKIVVDFGVNIAKVSEEVQERVKSAIETMTGLNVTDVNIRIAGIATV